MSSYIPAEQLLETVARQVDSAELYEARASELPVTHRGGMVTAARQLDITGRALRVIKDGRLAFATTTDLTSDSTLVRDVLEAALLGDQVSFVFPQRLPAQPLPAYDAAVARMGTEELASLAEEVSKRVKADHPQVDVYIEASRKVEEIRLLNSHGLDVEDQRTLLTLRCEIAKTGENEILRIRTQVSRRRLQDLQAAEFAAYLCERLRWAQRSAPVKTGTMPVVFSPQGAILLYLRLTPGLIGRNVLLGSSPLRGKLGQRVFDPQLTLIDDGRQPYGIRSSAYDDEGVPTATRPLIEQGMLRGFVYDLRSAAQAAVLPTGNGFRAALLFNLFGNGFRQSPNALLADVVIAPGTQSLPQILQNLDEALLVDATLGAYQGNLVGGEFSNNVALGFLVRRGEVIGRVRNTMIAGNVYELLKDRLIALSDQPQWVEGPMCAPAVAIDGVSVASQS